MRIASICLSGLFVFQLLFISCAEAAALQCQSLLENHPSSILQKERVPTYSDFVREVELRMKSNGPIKYLDPMLTQPRNLKPSLDSYFMTMLFDEWKPEKSKINLPFTGLYRMKIDLHLNQNQYLNKIIQMLDIFYSSDTYAQLLSKINLWVTSPNQAVLIYDALVETRILEENPQLLIQLTKINEHFQSGNVLVQEGLASFVSLSFEKESTSPEIVEYIKFGRVSESDWQVLSKEERFS